MENKERNVINKYLDVDFDFMHGSFWLKITLSKLTTENINCLQYPFLCKKKENFPQPFQNNCCGLFYYY
jgi:hypothetical protein